jgi:ATP-dependent helicase/DNAse subunit B
MPLTLVTGPANAGKARHVLDGVRARLRHDPILVVPTVRDAQAYRRELAERGAVFGAQVLTFTGLAAEIATRAGTATAALGRAQRERLVEAAIAGAGLEELAESARAPGFALAASELVAELQRELVTPQNFTRAMRAWGEARGREAYAEEVSAIYSRYRALLDRLGRVDGELLAWRALDALREAPARWGTTPVFLYGFDDLTRLERDAVETLAGLEGVDVMVALTFEARAALAGRASTFQDLAPLAAHREELRAEPGYYAAPALHHLERNLFEDEAPRHDPGDGVRLLEAGGERAELELVGAEVRGLLDEGVPAEEIAVVFRSPRESAGLVGSVFESYGIPVSLGVPVPFSQAPLGRALLGLLRSSGPGGQARDLLAWLRAPGLLEHPWLADRLEGDVRRTGATTAEEARAIWEERHWPLEALDRLGSAAPQQLLGLAGREAERLLAAPRRRTAAILDEDEQLDAAALRAALDALAGLTALARDDPALAPDLPALVATLERVEVRLPDRPGSVRVLDPLSIRARRVRALFACGLQEGEFPRPSQPEPFLPDDVRRELAEASGLILREREDALDDERALFYAVASRPEAVLGLSYRTSDEEGRPAVRSFFVDDVRDLFDERLDAARRRRPLADVTWPEPEAPTPRERARAQAAARPPVAPPGISALRVPAVLAELRDRDAWSAAHLEEFAGCAVQWLVDRYLRPEKFEPESEPLARGTAAHGVLEATLRRLREEAGSARVDQDTLPRALELLDEELRAVASGRPLSLDPARSRSVLRRLQADLMRYLRRLAERPTEFAPEHLELSFGGTEDELPAVELGGLRLRGRIDRVDTDGADRAAVLDYKGSQAYEVAKWAPQGRLQVALYMLAVRELLGLEPVAGFYQATSGKQAMRGAVRDDTSLADAATSTDRLSPGELEETLAAAAARAEEVASLIAAGEIEARPASCGWENSCQYPTICRCER